MIVPKETQEQIVVAAVADHIPTVAQISARVYLRHRCDRGLGADEAHEIALKANVGITRAMRGDLSYLCFPYPGDGVRASVKRLPLWDMPLNAHVGAVRPKELEVHLL